MDDTQHSRLTLDRWKRFTIPQQILMIANELNRTRWILESKDPVPLQPGYERALNLLDLTIEARPRRGLRRELLRWRDLLGALYVSPEPSLVLHEAAMRALLTLTVESYEQVELLFGPVPDFTSVP